MPYYVWKRNGEVVAYDHSNTPRPAPAVEISAEEARELGFYVPPAAVPDPEPEPSPTVESLQTELDATRKKLDATIQSNAMLEDCLVEMAQVVYA